MQEFEGALGAGARRNIAVCAISKTFDIEELEDWRVPYMCARFPGTISLSSPTRALPVARIRFSPFAVRGMSVLPVCLPLRDHSVSPCRTMKTRGSGMML